MAQAVRNTLPQVVDVIDATIVIATNGIAGHVNETFSLETARKSLEKKYKAYKCKDLL